TAYVSFFFQAEDGIRDFHVTGVQTYALPICLRARRRVHELLRLVLRPAAVEPADVGRTDRRAGIGRLVQRDLHRRLGLERAADRSEERRVGTERRARRRAAQWTEERKHMGEI